MIFSKGRSPNGQTRVKWSGSVIIALLAIAQPAAAHELRPGFLEITETQPGNYDVRFKVPARGDFRLRLSPRFPASCANVGRMTAERSGHAFVDRYTMACGSPLTGQDVSIDGLARTFTDVIARVTLSDGSVQTGRLTPDLPSFQIIAAPTALQTAETYFLLGMQHILLGLDHLLFVLALLLIIRSPSALVKTITAFTIAHSITLTFAALGWASAPQPPVEAVVALSIVFAAAEGLHGRSDMKRGAPWVMAFGFGLLHGFGFGGALQEIGLPQSDVPLALFAFNVGVEAGQLIFVTAILGLVASLDRLLAIKFPRLRDIAAYGIGSIAATWFFQRLAVIF